MEIDLSEAKVGGMVQIKEYGQHLNLKIISINPVIGQIGGFTYDVTRIVEEVGKGNKDYKVEKFAQNEDEFYGYKPRDLFEVKDFVHRERIGDKDAILIINYHNKLWRCEIINFYPNPYTWNTGGVYYSVEEYLKRNIDELKEYLLKS